MKIINKTTTATVAISFVLLSGLLSLISFYANSEEAPMTINQVITQYETALNASDTAAVMALYAQSPVFMPQHAPALEGREQVQAGYEMVFNTIQLNVAFTIHEIEEFGDTAWARTSSAGKTKILANEAVIDEGNNELFVFKKENGEWKIHRYLFSTTTPRQ